MSDEKFFRDRNKHTEVKLEIYHKYLEAYLSILAVSKWIKKITVYDLFCGPGSYDDSTEGSPLLAAQAIQSALEAQKDKTKVNFTLCLNDINPNHVFSLETKLEPFRKVGISIDTSSKSCTEYIDQIIKPALKKLSGADRSLIFLDPFGYKNIKKDDLASILNSGKIEILLFLPITAMRRFMKAVSEQITNENKSYIPLNDFICDFEHEKDWLRNSSSDEDLILRIKDSMKQVFGDVCTRPIYVSCFDLKNREDNRNHYALFHFTPEKLGKEKILEVFWKIDKTNGRGFNHIKIEQQGQLSLPGMEVPQRYISELKEAFLKGSEESGHLTNTNIKCMTMNLDCTCSQAKKILKKMENDGEITVDSSDGDKRKKGQFPALTAKASENRRFTIRLAQNNKQS